MQNHKSQLLDDKIDHIYRLLGDKIDHRFQLLSDKIDHRFQLLSDKIDHKSQLLDRRDKRLDDKIDHRYELLNDKIAFYYRLLGDRGKRNYRGPNRKIDAGDRQLFEMLLDLTNRVAKLEGTGKVSGCSAAQSEGLGAQPEPPIDQARQAVRDQGQAGQRVDEPESEPDAEESPETAR